MAKRVKEVDQSERPQLEELLEERKEARNRLRREENGRKRRRDRKKLRKEFYQNPFKVAKQMVSPTVPVQLSVAKEVLDKYVFDVASDPEREVGLGVLSGLPETPAKKVVLNVRPFTFTQL